MVGNWIDEASLTRMAGVTLYPGRNRDMGGCLAFCRCSVVAVVASACPDRIRWCVCVGDSQPAAGGLMAAFAISRHRTVRRCCRLTRRAICSRHVASCALGKNGNIPVEQSRPPAHISAFVTSVAIGDDHTSQRLVGDMVCRFAVGRCVGPGVASRTLVGHR